MRVSILLLSYILLIASTFLFSCASNDTIEGSSLYDQNMACQCDSLWYGLTREELVDIRWPEFQKYPGYINCSGQDSIKFLNFVLMRDDAELELIREAIYNDSVSTMKIYEEMDRKLGIE